jgi:hypothetical protein
VNHTPHDVFHELPYHQLMQVFNAQVKLIRERDARGLPSDPRSAENLGRLQEILGRGR